MSMFEPQVEHYKKKYTSLVNSISAMSIMSIAKSYGVSEEALRSGLETNNETFRRFCLNYASTLMPGRVSCTTYAAVVACVAKMLGVECKVYTGFCLQKNSPRYQKDRGDWDAKHNAGEAHPFFANHVFAVISGVPFEYFNGDFDGIDHVDVVEIN